MGQTSGELRKELDQKREELSRDVERLEHKVKSTLDINHQVEQKPLLAAGLAVFGGFLLGSMMGGGKHEPRGTRGAYTGGSAYAQPTYYSQYGSYSGQASTYSAQPQHGGGPGIMSGVKEGLRRSGQGRDVEDTISNISAALTALLVEKAKDMLDSNLPGFAEKYDQSMHQSRYEQRSSASVQESSAATHAPATSSEGHLATSTSPGVNTLRYSERPATGGDTQIRSTTTQ